MGPRHILIAGAMALSACGDPSTAASPVPICAAKSCAPVEGPPAELVAYLDHALDIMQVGSINKKRINWPAFRADVHQQVIAGRSYADMHAGIVYALDRLGDEHSYIAPPPVAGDFSGSGGGQRTPLAAGTIVAGRVAWIAIPTLSGRGDSTVAAADQVQEVITDLDRQNPCGWIVDLRHVLGGEMWPALAGLSPVLGDGTLGAYVNADDVRVSWFAGGGSVGTKDGTSAPVQAAHVTTPYALKRGMPPVAVVLSGVTQGAGEALATAFSGRPSTRFFGAATFGQPTVDQAFELKDGWTMYLTIAVDEDRTGRVFWPAAISPDEVVPMALYYPSSDDDAALAAAKWLLGSKSCAA